MKEYLTKENQQLVDKFKEDGLYNPDYVEYDERGIKTVHCMRCGEIIISRDTIETKCPHCGRTHLVEIPLLKNLPNLKRVLKELDDDSLIELLVCEGCQEIMEKATEEENKRIWAQINAATVKEMLFLKRSSDKIKEHLDKKQKVKIKEK
jgi:tRNA G26 N,N-dimethylase Trm1